MQYGFYASVVIDHGFTLAYSEGTEKLSKKKCYKKNLISVKEEFGENPR